MQTQNRKYDKKKTLFNRLNAKLIGLDPSIGPNVKCPLCWQSFSLDSLSLEHVPPVSTARLIGEETVKTLTCSKCNNTFGTENQNDLKHFLIYQLHQHGKYDRPIRGTITVPSADIPALHSNIVLTPSKVSVIGVPKANPSYVTQEHIKTWNDIAEKQTTEWDVTVTVNYGFKLPVAWTAYLQSAYLLAYVLTNCDYAFRKAGKELRQLLSDKKTEQIGPCVILPQIVGVGGKLWMAQVIEPADLRCLLAKVAGNIVILPLPDDDKLLCYKAWQRVCQQTNFGLSPSTISFRIRFRSNEDALEAQKCIKLSFQTSRSS